MDIKLKAGDAFFTDGEFSLRRMAARPQRGLPYSELFKPGCWSYHTQHAINPGTLIDVLPEDGSYYALLIVQSKNASGIAVAELFKKELDGVTVELLGAEEVVVEWGGAHKWRVVRAEGGDVLAKELPNEQEAVAWAASNRKKIVAKAGKVAA